MNQTSARPPLCHRWNAKNHLHKTIVSQSDTLHHKYGNIMEHLDLCGMREVGYTSTKPHFANSWVHKPLKYTLLSVYVRDAFRISTWSLSSGLCFQVSQLTAFTVLLLVVLKQRCITAGAPFWIGGELPVFIVRPHAPNREVRTVTVRDEYMYCATPNKYV